MKDMRCVKGAPSPDLSLCCCCSMLMRQIRLPPLLMSSLALTASIASQVATILHDFAAVKLLPDANSTVLHASVLGQLTHIGFVSSDLSIKGSQAYTCLYADVGHCACASLSPLDGVVWVHCDYANCVQCVHLECALRSIVPAEGETTGISASCPKHLVSRTESPHDSHPIAWRLTPPRSHRTGEQFRRQAIKALLTSVCAAWCAARLHLSAVVAALRFCRGWYFAMRRVAD
jgi:hypothetical protein